MKIVAIILFVCCFTTVQAQTKKKKKVPQPIKVAGIPEKRPVSKSKQKKWYYRWITRDKLPSVMLEEYATGLTVDIAAIQIAYDKEDSRKTPREPVLEYFNKLMTWYKTQQEIVRKIKTNKTLIEPIRDSAQPRNIEKRKALEREISLKITEFKELVRKKPSKPE